MTETTALYQAHVTTDAAYQADSMDLDKLRASDAAYAAYMLAIKAAREEWQAIPAGDAKDSAETNAFDTEGTDVDELRWFEIAIATYEMNS